MDKPRKPKATEATKAKATEATKTKSHKSQKPQKPEAGSHEKHKKSVKNAKKPKLNGPPIETDHLPQPSADEREREGESVQYDLQGRKRPLRTWQITEQREDRVYSV